MNFGVDASLGKEWAIVSAFGMISVCKRAFSNGMKESTCGYDPKNKGRLSSTDKKKVKKGDSASRISLGMDD